MSAVALVALAAALVCWPSRAVPRRLRAAMPGPECEAGPPGRRRWRTVGAPAVDRLPDGVPVVAAGVLGELAAGLGGVVAGLVLGLVVVRARRSARDLRARVETAAGLAEALGAFAAELRTGAPPALAARAAARDHTGLGARALSLVAATATLGGDVPAALRRAAPAARSREGSGARELGRFADAWSLAERHGIGLADLAGAVAIDLRARSRFIGALRAQVAGPRATAAVLAMLPVLGVLLGEGVGAHPWRVLSGSVVGQVLLVVGVTLLGAGMEWTERLIAGVSR